MKTDNELTPTQLVTVRRAREVVADVRALDWSDDMAMARALGALKSTVEALLDLVDGEAR
ncbi:hypothetical protein [Streptomyces sp. IBSBF 2806]|uniref:hypothetical protein n=1 Tax=Streptomyces sp. IBSBF 2806 TaxID=2903529 RepID=UPI002FDBEB8F